MISSNSFSSVPISIVVPTYQSGNWIGKVIASIIETLDKNFAVYELIVVNDGGDIVTANEIEKHFNQNKTIHLINCPKRVRQQQATWLGINKAKGDVIITIDDDGEFSPKEIITLYNYWKQTNKPLTYGIPNTLRKGGLKIWLYKLYLYNLKRRGEERKSSFRLLDSRLLHSIPKRPTIMPNIDIFLESYTSSIGFVAVQYTPGDSSRYTVWDYLRVLWNAILYRYNLRKEKCQS